MDSFQHNDDFQNWKSEALKRYNCCDMYYPLISTFEVTTRKGEGLHWISLVVEDKSSVHSMCQLIYLSSAILL